MMLTANLAMAAVLAVGATQIAAPGYSIIDRIPGPDGGWDYLRIDPDHNQLLVPRGASVMAVDLATKKVTTGLAPGGRQHVALPLPGGKEMVVTNGANNTALFANEVDGTVIASVPVSKGPDAAAFDPKTGLVLVVGHSGGGVTLVDPKSHKVVADVEVGGTLEEVVADGRGKAFVNVEDKNEIAVIDIAAHKTVAHWKMAGCEGPTGLAYDPDDRLLIAACDGVTVLLRAQDGKLSQTLNTGDGADGAAYDTRRHLAFIPAGGDAMLSVIGFNKGKAAILEKVPTERGARTVTLDERTGRVYLLSNQSGVAAPAVPGARTPPAPGSFHVLVVGPR